jgi:hypothetical protein
VTAKMTATAADVSTPWRTAPDTRLGFGKGINYLVAT